MTASQTTYFIASLAVIIITGLLKRIEDLRAECDRALVRSWRAEGIADAALEDLAAETHAHAETKVQLATAEQAAADNLTSLCVVLDAHAQDVVYDPLGTDLIADEAKLRAVKP